MFKAAFPVFAIFQDELKARKSVRAFFFTAKIVTKYSSERFCFCFFFFFCS